MVQAAEKSGARITADFALEQGREVFAIPGAIDDPLSAGCHALIQEGAKLVWRVQDILQEFGETTLPQPYKPDVREQRSIFEPESDSFVEVYDDRTKILKGCKEPSSVDELMGLTALSLQEVSALLFDLQLSGLIEQNFTGKWKRI